MEHLLKDCLARVSNVQEAKDDEEVQAQEARRSKRRAFVLTWISPRITKSGTRLNCRVSTGSTTKSRCNLFAHFQQGGM